MSRRLPILDELALAPGNVARAGWLLACPAFVIAHHSGEIRKLLDIAGFEAGLKCLSAELALLHARRDEVGRYPEGPTFAAHLARIDMTIAARGRG